jgi:hypothetical protein
MAVKSSGSLSITTDIVGEFGGQAPHSLSEYYRNGANVPDAGANSDIATSGEISFSDFYGSVAELGVTISANTTNLNLLSAIEAVYGTQSASSVYRVSIASGVTIGATSGAPNNAAITWGDFPDGSTITLVNDGTIDALGGSAGSSGAGGTAHSTAPSGGTGGSGGDAIYANYSNQTMNITNNGNIRGGGGGGGGAGGGGKGGDGRVTNPATTYPWTSYQYSRSVPTYYWSHNTTFNNYTHAWSSQIVSSTNATSFTALGYDYERGPFVETVNFSASKFAPASTANYYRIRRRLEGIAPATYTYYDGGNGGAGGAGGVGQGYTQSKTNGSSGSGGASGPGPAGNGGSGGTGGPGGVFGAAGSAGNSGSNGVAGNYPPGASSGGSGGAAGAAGRYLVKGSNTVTVTGSGTTAGGTA